MGVSTLPAPNFAYHITHAGTIMAADENAVRATLLDLLRNCAPWLPLDDWRIDVAKVGG